jgi:hypothetical protein
MRHFYIYFKYFNKIILIQILIQDEKMNIYYLGKGIK